MQLNIVNNVLCIQRNSCETMLLDRFYRFSLDTVTPPFALLCWKCRSAPINPPFPGPGRAALRTEAADNAPCRHLMDRSSNWVTDCFGDRRRGLWSITIAAAWQQLTRTRYSDSRRFERSTWHAVSSPTLHLLLRHTTSGSTYTLCIKDVPHFIFWINRRKMNRF